MPLEYDLKQLDRRRQVLVSLDSSDATCYEIETRSMMDALLSKPDILIRSLHIADPSELISSITFARNLENNMPWRPRMTVTYASKREEGMETRHPTSLQWIVKVNGLTCIWDLSYAPAMLTLTPQYSALILAVFTFGSRGNQAQKGQRVGSLRIMNYDGKGECKKEILCTLAAVMVHWERAGKILCNQAANHDPFGSE